jgi:integrase
LLVKANLPDIRLYDLRHTTATLLLSAGLNPKIVSERLGHASIVLTLDTYSHVLPTMQREATNELEAIFTRKIGSK